MGVFTFPVTVMPGNPGKPAKVKSGALNDAANALVAVASPTLPHPPPTACPLRTASETSRRHVLGDAQQLNSRCAGGHRANRRHRSESRQDAGSGLRRI